MNTPRRLTCPMCGGWVEAWCDACGDAAIQCEDCKVEWDRHGTPNPDQPIWVRTEIWKVIT